MHYRSVFSGLVLSSSIDENGFMLADSRTSLFGPQISIEADDAWLLAASSRLTAGSAGVSSPAPELREWKQRGVSQCNHVILIWLAAVVLCSV